MEYLVLHKPTEDFPVERGSFLEVQNNKFSYFNAESLAIERSSIEVDEYVKMGYLVEVPTGKFQSYEEFAEWKRNKMEPKQFKSIRKNYNI